MRSTTLTTRTFRLGACLRSSQAAATISRVGMSPAAASTTSGSPPSSLLAQGQIDAPAAQCLMAASMSSHCSCGCLSMTIRLT